MTNIHFIKISWQDLEKDCIDLAKKLKEVHIDKIVAISRGGLVVARILSDLLDIPISHITIASYQNLKQEKEPRITEAPSANFEEQNILVVDEVSDTGDTFKRALSYFENLPIKHVYTLAPYIKTQTKHTPDFFDKSMDGWIIFPYEVRETTEAFLKMFQSKEHAKEQLLKVGFEEWEIKHLL